MDQKFWFKTNPRKTSELCNLLKIYSIILSVICFIFVLIIFIISAHFSQIIMNYQIYFDRDLGMDCEPQIKLFVKPNNSFNTFTKNLF